jgi:hypothetical protein
MAADAITDLIIQAATRRGVDPQALLRIGQIESGLRPDAQNPRSSAGGLFQFIDSTAKQYGLTNKFDPAASADAGARLAADNAAILRRALGADPTPGQLYLAHQQGAGGATKLLTNPDASAASLVGQQAVVLNGGRPDMTAREFAGLWDKKMGVGGGGGQAMQMPPGTQPEPAGAPADGIVGAGGSSIPVPLAYMSVGPDPGAMAMTAMQQTLGAHQQEIAGRDEKEQRRRAALFGAPRAQARTAVGGLFG